MAGHLKPRKAGCDAGVDVDTLLANLESPDELVRAKALQRRRVATHIEREIVEIESIERWVDRVTEEGLPYGDRDFVRRRLEMRRQRRGY